MDKHTFDDAIGATPASTVDVDAIVTRQRRVTVLQRLAAPAAVAAGAVIVLTVGIAIASPGASPTRDAPAAGGPGSGVTATSAAPGTALSTAASGASGVQPTMGPNDCATPPDSAVIDAVLVRLTDEARAVFAAQAPAVTLSTSEGGAWRQGELGPLEFGHVADPTRCTFPNGYLISYATASDTTGTSEIQLMLQPAPMETTCLPEDIAPHETFCEVTQGPGGESIKASTTVTDYGVVTHRLDVSRPDGTGVSVQASNGAPKTDVAPTAPAPHFSHAQLTAIALDPALNLFANR